MMKEFLPVLVLASILSPGCTENVLTAITEDTAVSGGEVTPLPSGSASGEMFLKACGPVSTMLAPISKSDSEPEAKSLAAINAYNATFALAMKAALKGMGVTELSNVQVPLTVGLYLDRELKSEGASKPASDVVVTIALGDLSGAWQDWLDDEDDDKSVRSFFHYYKGSESFIECEIWANGDPAQALYDWNDLYGYNVLVYSSTIYQQHEDDSSVRDIAGAVSVQYTKGVIESEDSKSIGDSHYVTHFSGDLLVSHGVEESDVACDLDTTCGPFEDFMPAEDLVLATTQGFLASQMDYMTTLAWANILTVGEGEVLVVAQVDVGSLFE